MGDTGKPRREIEVEPATPWPTRRPAPQPTPAPEPAREPARTK